MIPWESVIFTKYSLKISATSLWAGAEAGAGLGGHFTIRSYGGVRQFWVAFCMKILGMGCTFNRKHSKIGM